MAQVLDWMRQYPDALQAIGLVGFLFYIGSFKLVQMGRLCGNSAGFAAANVVAATCVLISLVGAFNLPSLLTQISFIGAGLYGIFRRPRRCADTAEAAPVRRRAHRSSNYGIKIAGRSNVAAPVVPSS